MDKPAFEVRTPDGREYRIWADGRTEGFGDSAVIINRIPSFADQRMAAFRDLMARVQNTPIDLSAH